MSERNAEIIKKLSEPLDASEVEFFPRTTFAWGDDVKCLLVPYKTSRIDQRRLDDACGHLWQTDYKREGNTLLCGIGICFEGEWLWRWAAGSETQIERVKGEASDAMKRAGFLWGIGRELYYYPTIYVSLNEEEYDKVQDKSEKIKYVPKNRFLKAISEQWRWTIKNTESGKPWIIGKDKSGKVRCDTNPYQSKNPR